eukprot:CAMPEP_0197667018 /NCGR_PEP_ID=MMETSP1338-20131121/64792_1 /TAXON_ID=43686 ORGANISM="Pelagodinium beii, Strain RCC1491" /NCGR_SAMPLE_ID=MMETSP1338 /ASSEMBLY_ACC=CAM_ASM_000754 /LENGTH=237 /DNA_ID=CAMNT_0043246163 /DNA_START=33 /DNA_END=743 /DNA_ORIENTATION=+
MQRPGLRMSLTACSVVGAILVRRAPRLRVQPGVYRLNSTAVNLEVSKLPDSLPHVYPDAIGIDEAGRGPLAGPVVAAAVAVAPGAVLPRGVVDSKRLTERRLEAVYEQLMASAGILYELCVVDSARIDEINILQATFEAMSGASTGVMKKADHFKRLLIDGNQVPPQLEHFEAESVVKGDSKHFSIAAASIIAKVTRDRLMIELDKIHPEYGFAKHKGYGTRQHFSALEAHGVLPVH